MTRGVIYLYLSPKLSQHGGWIQTDTHHDIAALNGDNHLQQLGSHWVIPPCNA